MTNYKRFITLLILVFFGWFILSPVIIYSLFSGISEEVRIYSFSGNHYGIDPVLYFYFAGMDEIPMRYGLGVFWWNYFDHIYAAIIKAIIVAIFIAYIIYPIDKLRSRLYFTLLNSTLLKKGVIDIISTFAGFIIFFAVGVFVESITISHLLKEREANYEMSYPSIYFSIFCWGLIGIFVSVGRIFLENLQGSNVTNLENISLRKTFNPLVIKSESLAKRCEICHQSDMFDPRNGGKCYRCLKIQDNL